MTNSSAAATGDGAPPAPEDVFQVLDSMGISYDLYHHRPVFTVAEGEDLHASMPGLHCRNLFLKDKRGAMILLSAANATRIDLKKLPAVIGCERLSFGSEDRLWRHLGVRPGSVCPFAVMNDRDGAVRLVLDASIMAADKVVFHPLVNHMSVALAPADLVRFAGSVGHAPDIVDLASAAPG